MKKRMKLTLIHRGKNICLMKEKGENEAEEKEKIHYFNE